MVDRIAWAFDDHGRVATEANHVFVSFLDIFFDLAAACIRLVALRIRKREALEAAFRNGKLLEIVNADLALLGKDINAEFCNAPRGVHNREAAVFGGNIAEKPILCADRAVASLNIGKKKLPAVGSRGVGKL